MIRNITDELYSNTPQTTLYHYTSLAGAKGMIDSGFLHATEIRYFTDAAEMRHTVDKLTPETWFREGFGASNTELLRQLREWLSHRLTNGHMLYVGCFTANGNLLSQWRSYCPTARGVSLGFNPRQLMTCISHQGWRLGKCIYGEAEQGQLAERLLDEIEQLAKANGENTDPSKRHPKNSFYDIFDSIETDLLLIAALLKHPAFHEEEEWRIVSPIVTNFVEANIDYREGPSMLVPFMNFQLPEIPDRHVDLEHVYLGPTPNQSISMNSLSNFLSKKGASPRKGLEYCGIPYRPW
jgi:hypothetical protein